ncbi:MAG: glycerol-phosphatase, partial [Mycobacterium sp.]|nr:glycerol-phosphatase [Mycobacterium sp.]
SLMVLTGVNSARDAVYAVPGQRATFIGHDLRALHQDADELAVGPQPAWQIDSTDNTISVTTAAEDRSDGLSIVRAVAHAIWSSHADGQTLAVEPGDDTARDALQRWCLV